MLDKTGNVFEKFQSVEALEPKSNDKYNHAFSGTVIDILESRGTVIVEDQCGDAFEIEPDRLIIRD